MLPSILTILISVLFRIILIKKIIPEYSITLFLKKTMATCLIVFVVSMSLSYYFKLFFAESFINFIITSIASLIIVTIVTLIIGLNNKERMFVKNRIISSFRHL